MPAEFNPEAAFKAADNRFEKENEIKSAQPLAEQRAQTRDALSTGLARDAEQRTKGLAEVTARLSARGVPSSVLERLHNRVSDAVAHESSRVQTSIGRIGAAEKPAEAEAIDPEVALRNKLTALEQETKKVIAERAKCEAEMQNDPHTTVKNQSKIASMVRRLDELTAERMQIRRSLQSYNKAA